MQRSMERFENSPERYFSDLDTTFANLRSAGAALAKRLDALTAFCDELAVTRVTAEAAGPLPQRWTYDARLPNHVFDDVFEAEPVPLGAKRWVGGSGRIAATLRLPRTLQYDITVHIEDFVSDAAAQSFYLRIDGVQYPWLDHAGKRYASLILAEPPAPAIPPVPPALVPSAPVLLQSAALSTLAFEIGIDRATIPIDRDVAFSFRLIDVAARA